MGMNPDTNRFEMLVTESQKKSLAEAIQENQDRFAEQAVAKLMRPDGTPVPKHWSVFRVGEKVVIKDYTFKVAYIGESNILFEPVGPVVIGEASE